MEGVMWNLLLRPLRGWYFRHSYNPQSIEEGLGSSPAQHRLDTVTWKSTRIPACITTSMQMIASHFGIAPPRRTIDFLMGFTYGAGELPGIGYMPVGADPETGFQEAAPYLGLKGYYFITNDPVLYLEAIRFHLAQGNPVRLPLDMGALYGTDDLIPHSEVFIGYDEDGFEYYEPVCLPPATCQPAAHRPGERGCYATKERLLEAVDSQSSFFNYPWRYALSLFEVGPFSDDMHKIWQRNGRNLVGGQRMGMRWGAASTEHLASQIERQYQNLDNERLQLIMEIGAFMRRENAVFLREIAGDSPELLCAADLFEKSARCFKNGLDALRRGITTPEEAQAIGKWLREIAADEREAGEIFLVIEESPGSIPTGGFR
jgi:hypothetical protein